jgi:hypothetical protein
LTESLVYLCEAQVHLLLEAVEATVQPVKPVANLFVRPFQARHAYFHG